MRELSDIVLKKEKQLREQREGWSPRETPRHSDAVMERFWLRMSEAYGHKWTSQFGSRPTSTWSAGLATLTLDQIAAGLRRLGNRGDPWPPALTEFVSLCKPKRENPGAYKYQMPALPKKITQTSMELAKTAIAEAKAKCGS